MSIVSNRSLRQQRLCLPPITSSRLPDVAVLARAGLGGEVLGAVLAGRGVTNLELVAVQFVDPQHGLALEWPVRIRDVDGFRVLGRVQRVRPLVCLACRLDAVLVSCKGQPGVLELRVGQLLAVVHTGRQHPGALQLLQVLLGCIVLRVFGGDEQASRQDQQCAACHGATPGTTGLNSRRSIPTASPGSKEKGMPFNIFSRSLFGRQKPHTQ